MSPARKSKKQKDDLTAIEGVGPKISQLLKKAKIDTYAKLAKAPVKNLRQVLEEAGGVYKSRDPSTWPKQARLARDGKWTQLKSLQDELDGGRKKTKATQARTGRKRKSVSSKKLASSKSAKTDNQPTATVVFSGINGGQYLPGQPFVIQRILSAEEELLEFQQRKPELTKEFEKARTCAAALWKRLQKLDEFETHISGISVRYRTKFGQPISPLRPVVAVTVRQKLTQSELARLGYQSIEDCCCKLSKKFQHETKVLEGEFSLINNDQGFFLRGTNSPTNALPFDQKVTGGVPIHRPADPLSNFGSLGIVSIANSERLPMALTAQHVVGTDSSVEQIDNNGVDRLLGTVTDVKEAPFHVPIGTGLVESIDAALIEILSKDKIKLPADGEWARGISHQVDGAPGAKNSVPIYYSTRRISVADKGRLVVVFGNGSGVRNVGKIDSIDQSTNIYGKVYNSNFTVEPYPNQNGSVVTPGDSGSVLAVEARSVDGVSQSAIIIVGVLFAALTSQTRAVACNMSAVVKGLGLKQKLKGSKFTDDWD